VSASRSNAGTVVEVVSRAPATLAEAVERGAWKLQQAIAGGYPPGGALVVVDADGVLARSIGGWACVVGEHISTSQQTRYDLASLTKVLATVPLALAFAERGLWRLDDRIVEWLPDFPRHDIALRSLLTHTSGLPAHSEFYRLAGGPEAIRRAVVAEATPGLAPGTVCYSDLGYMLLGWALEACARRPLEELFDELIAKPLGLTQSRFCPPLSERRLTAATELDGDQRLTPGLVWGEVHDGNAWALGGVAGHAGLFAPVDDVARAASALLAPDRHPVLSAASLAGMRRRQAGAPPDVRALGWRLDAADWGAWPPDTCWHTGFTGTSVLFSVQAGLAVVLLFGGVHPRRQPERQQSLRAAVHREIAGSLA
jgi:serine-type D-Ala-D-Ala carboxypeptidase